MPQRAIEGLTTEEEEAERLGIKLRTLRAWKKRGYGPMPTTIGRFVYYTDKAHNDFLAAGARPFPKRAGGRVR